MDAAGFWLRHPFIINPLVFHPPAGSGFANNQDHRGSLSGYFYHCHHADGLVHFKPAAAVNRGEAPGGERKEIP